MTRREATILDSRQLRPRIIDGAPSSAVPVSGSDTSGEVSMPDPGRCSGEEVLSIFVFDDSLSVTGGSGTDPLARRYREAKLAIDHIGAACRCGKELVSVIHFDHSLLTMVAPQRLTRRGRFRIKTGLRPPRGVGTSDLGPALSAAEKVAGSHDGRQIAVVVFSDFLLTDQQPDLVLGRLAAFPGAVHAVALDARPPDQLKVDPRVTTSVISRTSQPGELARTMAQSLITYRVAV